MDSPAQLHIDLNNLMGAKRIIRSIQRDCRATLRLLAVLEEMDKESDEDDDKGQRRSD